MNDNRDGHFLPDPRIVLNSDNKRNIINIANSTRLTPSTEEQLRLYVERGFIPSRGVTQIAKKIIMDIIKKH